ncbi:hypothetical protein TURU_066755 [Turdus rufiventris]|nr:hypothetical protein TURU_066755 [Turdus rufiventris]
MPRKRILEWKDACRNTGNLVKGDDMFMKNSQEGKDEHCAAEHWYQETPSVGSSNRIFDYSLTSTSSKSMNSAFAILPARGQEYDHPADGAMGLLLSPPPGRDASAHKLSAGAVNSTTTSLNDVGKGRTYEVKPSPDLPPDDDPVPFLARCQP